MLKNPLNQKCRGAMRYAHEAYGFDFCKPYDLYEGSGKFTLNSIKKAFAEKFGHNNFKNGICLLFMPCEGGDCFIDFYCVRVLNNKFDIDVIKPDCFRGYSFFLSRDFERDRKKYNKTFYVIFQNREHLDKSVIDSDYKFVNGSSAMLSPISTFVTFSSTSNCFTRFYRVNHRYGNFWQVHDGSICKFRVNYTFNEKFDLDKSGYPCSAMQLNLHGRLRRYKEEKVKTHDYSAQEKVIEAQLATMRAFLAEKLAGEMTFSESYEFERLSSIYAKHFRKYKEHTIGKYVGTTVASQRNHLLSIIRAFSAVMENYDIE